MATSRWVKPAVRTTAPRHLATVVVSTRPAAAPDRHGRTPHVADLAVCTVSRFRRGKWDGIETARIDSPAEVHSWLEARTPDRGSLWVVAPVASAALTLTGFWKLLDARGAKWSGRGGPVAEAAGSAPSVRLKTGGETSGALSSSPDRQPDPDSMIVSALVTNGKPDIIRYRVGPKSLVWVSGTQYFTASEESLAHTVGFQWPRSGGPIPAGSVMLRDPADRAELWALLFRQLSEWWIQIDGGPFAATPGGMGMSFVKRRLVAKTLLAHQQPRERELEERALFGGRATTWFYGRVGPEETGRDGQYPPKPAGPFPFLPGPLQHWDVASMYPSILSREWFPTRISHGWDRPSLATVKALADEYVCIVAGWARVTRPEYPTRAAARIVHPTGYHPVTLTGPELARALADGTLVRVDRCTTYLRGRPFQVAADELIQHRANVRASNLPAREMFVKLLANSIGGKLAQRGHEWRRRPDLTGEKLWGEWTRVLVDTGEVSRYRSRGGLVDERVVGRHTARPLAACFCVLTSHGRYLMRLLREFLPPRTVVSQDTDGLWVTGAALGMFDEANAYLNTLGYTLRNQKEVRTGVWFGPRHYWTSDGWVLAGVTDNKRWTDGLTFEDSYQTQPTNTASDDAPLYVYLNQRTVRLNGLHPDGTVGEDGWLVPSHSSAPPPVI